MANTVHEEHKTLSHNLQKGIATGDDFVAGFISGATVGALAGGALTAGSGILPGAVVGGIVGAVAPKAVSSFSGIQDGHKS